MMAHKLVSCVLILAVLFTICPVSATEELIPNVTKTNEYIGIGPNNFYTAELTSGHWTVIVDSESFWNLEIRIIVALASNSSEIIAVSGTEKGNFPQVDFTLDVNTTVDITVEKNSEDPYTSGYYEIGVYDDSHIPGFFASLDLLDFLFLLIITIVIVTICGVIFAVRHAKRGFKTLQGSVRIEAPLRYIPESYQGSIQHHGSETTTVRLPLKCPSCGAEVSHESVDWVGPLEAKCNYCGGTMRATFERV